MRKLDVIEALKISRKKFRRKSVKIKEFDFENVEKGKYATDLEACYLFSKEYGTKIFVFVCHGLFDGKIIGKWYLKENDYYIDPFYGRIIIDPGENLYDEKGILTWIKRKIVFEGEINEEILRNVEEYYKKWFVNWPKIPEKYEDYWRRRYLEIVEYYIKNRLNFAKYVIIDKNIKKGMYLAGRFRALLPDNLSEEKFVEHMKILGWSLKNREEAFIDEIIHWLGR